MFLPQYPPRFSMPISMNSGPVDATSLLTSLETSQDFGGLYHHFSSVLQPFENFIFLYDYSVSAVKKKTRREKKPKELPSKEKILPIARQFHQFLCKALKLLPDLLRRIPSNGAVDEEGMKEERAAELLGIYRITIRCFLCIAPYLTGLVYWVNLQWGQLVHRLETWNKYNYAKEVGFALLQSLHTLLVTPPPLLKPTMLFLPDPSVVGSAGTDPQLACLVLEVVIVLTFCTFKSQSRDTGAFERILALAEQVHPWFCMMKPKAMTSRHTILVAAIFRCALFLAGESNSFDDHLVYSFCLKMLKECIESDHFPIMAHQICSAIDVKWDIRSSLIVGVLSMSVEGCFCGNKMLSWENLPILKNQEVYRMPSGKAGKIPTIEELLLALENQDLYLYFGHGSGMQYIRADSFGKLHRCAAAFLMGCSSGSLRHSGSYAPKGAPLHYLFAGSPSVIANLWEVSDKDINRFAMAMLNSWTQDSILLNSCIYKCSKLTTEDSNVRRKASKVEETVEDKCMHCEAKMRVASFISQARGACRLPTIIGASVVCYGVPTILKRKQ